MSLSEKLNKAALTAKEINDLTDEANAIIQRVNKFLLDNRIGVQFWLSMPLKDNKHYLGIDRAGVRDEMVLAIRDTPPLKPFGFHPKPLTNCERELRLLAVQDIPVLLDAVIKELDREKNIAAASREAILKLRDKLN